MLDPSKMDEVLRRGEAVSSVVDAWKALDAQRRRLQGELDGLRQQRNTANEKMAKLDKKGPDFAAARDAHQDRRDRARQGRSRLGAGAARDAERAAHERARRHVRSGQPAAPRVG